MSKSMPVYPRRSLLLDSGFSFLNLGHTDGYKFQEGISTVYVRIEFFSENKTSLSVNYDYCIFLNQYTKGHTSTTRKENQQFPLQLISCVV